MTELNTTTEMMLFQTIFAFVVGLIAGIGITTFTILMILAGG